VGVNSVIMVGVGLKLMKMFMGLASKLNINKDEMKLDSLQFI
jgi:hypothetical protein